MSIEYQLAFNRNLLDHIPEKNHSEVKAIFELARKVSYQCFVQVLDCSLSWRRMNTEETFEEYFERYEDEKWYATCIMRTWPAEHNYYEFCISTMGNIAHFLYIFVKENELTDELKEKMKLC